MLNRCLAIRWLTLFACSLLVGIFAAKWLGYRINWTPSLPVGIWRQLTVPPKIERGQIVIICPPPSAAFLEARARGYLSDGDCPGGLEPMLKPVAAIAGDVVQLTAKGIVLNGAAQPRSTALAADKADRPLQALPAGRLTIPEGEVFLLSTVNGESFDSRYFGPLPVSVIQGAAIPVWVAEPGRERP